VFDDSIAEALAELNVPLVNTTPVDGFDFPYVSVDSRAAGIMAAEYCINRGYRDFGFFGTGGPRFSIGRERGFLERLEESGLSASGANTALAATGTITFSIDDEQVAVETVADGQASFTTNSLAAGDRAVTATYSGDDAYGTSSDGLTQSVALSAYDTWAASYDLVGDPDNDDDGDGMSNFQEFAFGLDPTSGASVNPLTDISEFQSDGIFSYTRFAGSGLSYTYWISTDLEDWGVESVEPLIEEAGEIGDDGVQTVVVVLALPESDKVFLRVKAE